MSASSVTALRGSRRHVGLDAVKGLAILGVLVLHAISITHLMRIWAVFHVWQAVPVFVIVWALNTAGSARRRGGPLRELYAPSYWRSRAARLLVPFLIVAAVSTVIALLRWRMLGVRPYVGWLYLAGVLPFGGPGNYFITLLLQLTLLGPLLFTPYRRRPAAFIAAAFAADLAFELLATATNMTAWGEYLYSGCILRYAAAVALGFWLADGALDPAARRERWVLAAGALGAAYMLAFQLGWRIPWILAEWQPQNLFAFAYAAVLVLAGARALDVASAPVRGLAALGNASYHIFLVQMLYFAFPQRWQPVPVLTDVIVCVAIGYAFYWIHRTVSRRRAAAGTPAVDTARSA